MIASEPGRPVHSETHVDSPATLRWAVRLLVGQAAALTLLVVYLIVQGFTADVTDLRVAIALTACTALVAVAVAVVGRALARHAAAARGPAIVIQIMLMGIGWYLLQAGVFWLGAPLLLLGLVAGVLLVLPPTTRALGLG